MTYIDRAFISEGSLPYTEGMIHPVYPPKPLPEPSLAEYGDVYIGDQITLDIYAIFRADKLSSLPNNQNVAEAHVLVDRDADPGIGSLPESFVPVKNIRNSAFKNDKFYFGVDDILVLYEDGKTYRYKLALVELED